MVKYQEFWRKQGKGGDACHSETPTVTRENGYCDFEFDKAPRYSITHKEDIQPSTLRKCEHYSTHL